MDIKQDNYITIPAIARLEHDLKGNDLLVYGIIHGFTQHRGWCDCGLQYICDWIGCSDKSRVSIIISRLVDQGVIEKQEVFVNNVKFCKYRVVPQHRSGKHNGGVVESTTNNIIDNILPLDIEESISVPKEEIDELFVQFWKDYDKKVGIDRAKRAWKKLTVEDKKAAIAYIPSYKQAQPNKMYRKNPEAYINQKAWNDELVGLEQKPADNHVWTV